MLSYTIKIFINFLLENSRLRPLVLNKIKVFYIKLNISCFNARSLKAVKSYFPYLAKKDAIIDTIIINIKDIYIIRPKGLPAFIVQPMPNLFSINKEGSSLL